DRELLPARMSSHTIVRYDEHYDVDVQRRGGLVLPPSAAALLRLLLRGGDPCPRARRARTGARGARPRNGYRRLRGDGRRGLSGSEDPRARRRPGEGEQGGGEPRPAGRRGRRPGLLGPAPGRAVRRDRLLTGDPPPG